MTARPTTNRPPRPLLDPSVEHDACGVGFVARIDGVRTHDIVEKGVTTLEALEHRGACGCDPLTGDGAGVLTHPAMLGRQVGPTEPAMVRRGVFVLREIVCSELGEPDPNAINTPRPTTRPSGRRLTNRESLDLLTANAPCSGCHAQINPAGAAFERYDAIGALRADDHGNPIDARGTSARNAQPIRTRRVSSSTSTPEYRAPVPVRVASGSKARP